MAADQGRTRRARAVAALLAAAPALPSAGACSCLPRPDTPAAVAAAVTAPGSDYGTDFMFVGRVLDEVSYAVNYFTGDIVDVPDDYDYDPEISMYQNITFSLEEILFNRAPDGSLPSFVQVGDEGTLTVATSTETTCCICGKGGYTVDGAENLVSLDGGMWGMHLSTCQVNCRISDDDFCADVAGALRSAGPPARGYCLTEADCAAASRGYPSFASGAFATATRGCFAKKGRAYFAPGSAAEMTATELPPNQERIRCDGAAAGGAAGVDDVACLTEEECRDMSTSLGFAEFARGDYATKGCFAKKGRAYFSPGGADDVARPDLPGVQERIWCTHRGVCRTAEACKAQSVELGLRFEQGAYPSKGCFSKKEVVYFSAGTDEEMAAADVPGSQERIRCNGEASEAARGVAKQIASSPAGIQKASALSEPGKGVLSLGSRMSTPGTSISVAASAIVMALPML